MCGIIGATSSEENIVPVLLNGLSELKNRGYDSYGIAYYTNQIITQLSLKDEIVTSNQSSIGIGHTRWATHGKVCLENTHPVSDMENHFSLVHNGIIENHQELKDHLLEFHYTFRGQTDSEVVVNYLHHLVQSMDIYSALDHLNRLLQGSWAILILWDQTPETIYFLKNGNPLLFGYGNGIQMLTSELVGFDPQIVEYIQIQDSDFGCLTGTEFNSKYTYNFKSVPKREQKLSPDPYPFWMIKEINDQSFAVNQCIQNFYQHTFMSERFEHLILLGCGTSYHAAQFGTRWFRNLLPDVTVTPLDGADFEISDVPQGRKICAIVLSQSGETKDLFSAVDYLKGRGIPLVGAINVEKSKLSNDMDFCWYLKAGREHAVASTKSFTNQIVLLTLMAHSLAGQDLDLSDLGSQIGQTINSLELRSVVEFLSHSKIQSCFILGKHLTEYIAHEASLKIKEIAYIHAEGYSVTSLKHGPFAILTVDTPVIFIMNDDIYYKKFQNTIEEVQSRGSPVIVITNRKLEKHNYNYYIYLNTTVELFPFISIVPFQLLAYHIAIEKGYNPDYPRNLAKVVTVE